MRRPATNILYIDMMFIEYIHANSEKFIQKQEIYARFNTYITNHRVIFSSSCKCRFEIQDSNDISIAYVSFMYSDDELYISSLSVNDSYRGQSIGTFLILLALQFVYQYTNIVGLSATKISVRLDDMSDASRKINNIYRFCGLHYENKKTNEPEMLSSLIHTTRICDIFFRSKIKSVVSTRETIFKRNVGTDGI